MDEIKFPAYRKISAPAGVRGQFATEQKFAFYEDGNSINIRMDNVFSIGYAPDMDKELVHGILNNYPECTADEFLADYHRVIDYLKEKIPYL